MQKKLKDDLHAFGMLVPMVLAVIIVFAILFVGIFVNAEISNSLQDTYPTSDSDKSVIQNSSVARLSNISTSQDSALDIVQVVIIITVLAAAIGAIFLFTRFGT
ncbi:unnamed protein product [marine sediment metagenome]|uniref:Uncharacterized protein n=1 Tax=marine sediment metagenome TaxID=412755 RepID=X0ZA00_9ZZZZ